MKNKQDNPEEAKVETVELEKAKGAGIGTTPRITNPNPNAIDPVPSLRTRLAGGDQPIES